MFHYVLSSLGMQKQEQPSTPFTIDLCTIDVEDFDNVQQWTDITTETTSKVVDRLLREVKGPLIIPLNKCTDTQTFLENLVNFVHLNLGRDVPLLNMWKCCLEYLVPFDDIQNWIERRSFDNVVELLENDLNQKDSSGDVCVKKEELQEYLFQVFKEILVYYTDNNDGVPDYVKPFLIMVNDLERYDYYFNGSNGKMTFYEFNKKYNSQWEKNMTSVVIQKIRDVLPSMIIETKGCDSILKFKLFQFLNIDIFSYLSQECKERTNISKDDGEIILKIFNNEFLLNQAEILFTKFSKILNNSTTVENAMAQFELDKEKLSKKISEDLLKWIKLIREYVSKSVTECLLKSMVNDFENNNSNINSYLLTNRSIECVLDSQHFVEKIMRYTKKFYYIANIGQGGQATVISAIDLSDSSIKAIKLFKMYDIPKNFVMAYHEKKKYDLIIYNIHTKEQDRERIVEMYDCGTVAKADSFTETNSCLIMKHVRFSLREYICEILNISERKISEKSYQETRVASKILLLQLIHIMTELTKCLKVVHGADCIHRDVKMDNFLVERNGAIVISDFGTCIHEKKSMDCDDDISSGENSAPETKGENPIYSKSADIFSLGILFEEILNMAKEKANGLEYFLDYFHDLDHLITSMTWEMKDRENSLDSIEMALGRTYTSLRSYNEQESKDLEVFKVGTSNNITQYSPMVQSLALKMFKFRQKKEIVLFNTLQFLIIYLNSLSSHVSIM